LKYFLGIEVPHSNQGISLCQRKYCLDLIKDFGLMGCKPFSTPMEDSLRFHQVSNEPLSDPLSYQRLVGPLIYLTSTKPDIAFVVEDGCCPFKIVFDEDLYVVFDEVLYVHFMCIFALL